MKKFLRNLSAGLIASLALSSMAYAQVDTSALETGLTALAVTVGVIFTAVFGNMI